MTQPDDYQLLTQDERDDMLAQTLLAQETDLFMHRINLERFNTILAGLPPDPAPEPGQPPVKTFRKQIEELRDSTLQRRGEVEAIISALKPQLPPKARLDAAATRLKARFTKPPAV